MNEYVSNKWSQLKRFSCTHISESVRANTQRTNFFDQDGMDLDFRVLIFASEKRKNIQFIV